MTMEQEMSHGEMRVHAIAVENGASLHSWGNLNQWTDPPINWEAVARQATKVDDRGCSFPKCGDLCIYDEWENRQREKRTLRGKEADLGLLKARDLDG